MNSSLLKQLLSPILSTPVSNRNCNIRSNDDDASASSRFQRTVCVYDWWLVKAEKDYEGKRLAVAGFTSREQQAMREFTSAPIVKRYDVFTLETADEICIVIKGFINKSRTMENGFSSEVFGHFMFGFPPYWEAYAEKFLLKEFMAGTGLFPDNNKAAADLEFAVDARMVNPNSNASPRKVNCKSKLNAGDINKCYEYVSENTATNASKSSDSPRHTVDHCDVVNTKNHVSNNVPPSTSCDIGNVSSREDNLVVRVVVAITSSYYMTRSSGRMVNAKSSMKGKTGTGTGAGINSNPKERESSEDINMKNAASVESPLPTGSDVDNNNPSNLESALSLGSSEVALTITSSGSKTSQKQKEIGKHKYGFNCENKNSPTTSGLQVSDAIVRCIGKKSHRVESSKLLNVGPTDETGNTVKNDNMCCEPQTPSHSASEKPGKGHKKKSQASSPRQNKNNLAKCRSWPVDRNHNCNSKNTVGGGERDVKEGSLREKARKKINFDADACPLTPKTKENSSIVSPESLSLKRSRSGRLLVPSLDFWRNQIAIYDADRKITGLQEGLELLNPSKGIPFEPSNKKKRRD